MTLSSNETPILHEISLKTGLEIIDDGDDYKLLTVLLNYQIVMTSADGTTTTYKDLPSASVQKTFELQIWDCSKVLEKPGDNFFTVEAVNGNED